MFVLQYLEGITSVAFKDFKFVFTVLHTYCIYVYMYVQEIKNEEAENFLSAKYYHFQSGCFENSRGANSSNTSNW